MRLKRKHRETKAIAFHKMMKKENKFIPVTEIARIKVDDDVVDIVDAGRLLVVFYIKTNLLETLKFSLFSN